MTAVEFHVNEVFDIAARGGLIVVGSTRNGDFVGIPRLRDVASGAPIRVLGVDHPTPRTRRTGETILVVDRADGDHVAVGRLWTAEA
ncbi:hypothetical protein Asp14428_49540 [Actinoplanes sp. NBRC 14428]|uniref:Uncharacterized protein n=1 Tax=Pseudosporangium ferrugineum TaxID=439699 RepID=A0A2T0S6J8_9ACTN|nr:hypothetical protein [Pseudosporangium ferrugineum]PRY29054.1 hypothetical protein CLV70_107363 [Pseudosporangium ferrugineum]BCJ53479.1 hypothetical protein Asp14428_49540 [Actinoplanes sp. NBRC 14428]